MLDKETGLIWSRYVPYETDPILGSNDFYAAFQICQTRMIGGRFGWRLPSIQELLSLLDRNSSDHLPPGNPFVITFINPIYWSSTTQITSQGSEVAMALAFVYPESVIGIFGHPKNTIHQIWCVRGGSGYDGFK